MLSTSFYHLPHLPKLELEYIQPAFTTEYILPEPEFNGVKTSRSVWANSPFSETKFFQDLQTHVGKPFTALYYKFEPMTVYDWHTDRDRNCAINFILSPDPNYMTIFREPTNNRILYNIKICDYTLYCPTLFNTCVSHTVINYSNMPRYILTVASKTATLSEVKDFVDNYTISSY